MYRPRRHRSAILLPAMVLALGGCESPLGDPAVGATAEPVLASARADASRDLPLRITGVGTFQSQDFAPGFGPPDFGRSTFGDRCSIPSDFVIRFGLAGQATHLGDYTADLEHCVQVDFATGLLSITDGVATFTAANGDELWDRYERLVPGSSAVDPEHHRFIGGTGRFAGASGEALALAVCDRAAGTCDVEMEGVLAYDASDAGS